MYIYPAPYHLALSLLHQARRYLNLPTTYRLASQWEPLIDTYDLMCGLGGAGRRIAFGKASKGFSRALLALTVTRLIPMKGKTVDTRPIPLKRGRFSTRPNPLKWERVRRSDHRVPFHRVSDRQQSPTPCTNSLQHVTIASARGLGRQG